MVSIVNCEDRNVTLHCETFNPKDPFSVTFHAVEMFMLSVIPF